MNKDRSLKIIGGVVMLVGLGIQIIQKQVDDKKLEDLIDKKVQEKLDQK